MGAVGHVHAHHHVARGTRGRTPDWEWSRQHRARTIESVLEIHGPCESLERSIVRIGLEPAELRVFQKRKHAARPRSWTKAARRYSQSGNSEKRITNENIINKPYDTAPGHMDSNSPHTVDKDCSEASTNADLSLLFKTQGEREQRAERAERDWYAGGSIERDQEM